MKVIFLSAELKVFKDFFVLIFIEQIHFLPINKNTNNILYIIWRI